MKRPADSKSKSTKVYQRDFRIQATPRQVAEALFGGGAVKRSEERPAKSVKQD